MSRKTHIPLILVLGLSLLSCDPNRVYKEFDKDFDNYRWEKGHSIVFEPTISDTSKAYEIELGLRHVYGFQFASFPVEVAHESPSGLKDTLHFEFEVIGENGKYRSNCAEDICDLEVLFLNNFRFREIGTHRFEVRHEIDADFVPNVMEFGMVITGETPDSAN